MNIRYAGVTGGIVSAARLYYDTDDQICTEDFDLGGNCANDGSDWTLLGQINNPRVGVPLPIPANATAIKIEADFFDSMFQPNGQVLVDLETRTPAQLPDGLAADQIAWNTVAAAGRTDDDGEKGLSPKSEGNKVGVAMATGPLELVKRVDGPGAEYATGSYNLTVTCRSAVGTPVEDEVDLGDAANQTVTADEVIRIDDLPWGSECTVTEPEDVAGDPDFSATTVTVGRDPENPVQIVATNTYPVASLVLQKAVEDSAVDENGDPITYGPFTFTVDCTYPDGETPVYADGFSAEKPMTASFSSDESYTFTGLPADAEGTATETDTAEATSTTSEATTGQGSEDEQSSTGSNTIGPLTLTKDGAGAAATNEVTFINTFDTGSLVITKVLTGPGADFYGAGPFTVHLTCTAADLTVYDGDIVLGGDQPLTATVDDLYVDSSCEVTEPQTGGANSVTVSPEGQFPVTADSAENPVAVTVTNRFDVGSLRVIKKVVDDGDLVSDQQDFAFEVTCEGLVNGEVRSVDLGDDATFTLSEANGLSYTVDDLPTGAVCTVTETDTGGADDTIIQPGEVTIGNAPTVDVIATNTFDPPPGNGGCPDCHLPSTGGPSLIILGVGALLLIAGGTLIAARRRRD